MRDSAFAEEYREARADIDWSEATKPTPNLTNEEIVSRIREAVEVASTGPKALVWGNIDGFDVKITVELDY